VLRACRTKFQSAAFWRVKFVTVCYACISLFFHLHPKLSTMADSANFAQPSIPKFDGFYDHWAMLMENLLRSKEFCDLIETGVTVALENPTPEQEKAAKDSKLQGKELSFSIHR